MKVPPADIDHVYPVIPGAVVNVPWAFKHKVAGPVIAGTGKGFTVTCSGKELPVHWFSRGVTWYVTIPAEAPVVVSVSAIVEPVPAGENPVTAPAGMQDADHEKSAPAGFDVRGIDRF